MGFIKPTAGKGGRAEILPPSFRRAFSGADQIKTKRFIVREVILFPLSMALLIATVSPEPVPLTHPDPALIWPKSLCSSGWCNCTRINEVPSTAELAGVSYGRRGFNQVDVLHPVVIKDGLRIQCYCTKGQNMQINHVSLPLETLEFEVVGCDDVSFSSGSLFRPTSLASILIRSSKKISFRKNLYVPQSNIPTSSLRPPDALRWDTEAPSVSRSPRGVRTARPPYGIPPAAQTVLRVSEAQSFSVETGAFRTIPTVAPPSIADIAAAAVSVRPRPSLSVRLHRVGHVLVEGASFGKLDSFAASEVRRMEMREHAFSAESAPDVLASLDGSSKNGATLTTVSFRDVTIPWIPRHAFPSSATEVNLQSSQVTAIRRDAFSALTFSGITLMDSAIEEIESGAFSGRTLCQRLTLHHVRVRNLYRNAFRSAINKLSVSHSWITQVGSGAFNMTIASASITDNVFENVRNRGFSLREWDQVILRNNTFLRLESGSFSGLIVSDPGPDIEGQDDSSASSSSSTILQVYSLKQLLSSAEIQSETTDAPAMAIRRLPRFAARSRELNITENVFGDTPGGSLSLLPLGDYLGSREDKLDNVAMVVSDNRFRHGCHCGMTVWLKSVTKDSDAEEDEDTPSPRSWSRFLYNTSLCLVDSDLARCFNVSVGFMRMKDFVFIVCPEDENAEAALPCDAEEENPAVHKAVVVVVVPDTAAGAGGADLSGGGELEDGSDAENELERNKKILHTIFGTVVVCICVILIVTFVRRTRWWKRVRERSVMEEEEGGTCWAIARVLLAMRVSSTLRRSEGAVGGKENDDGEGISGADSITRLSIDGYNEMIEENTVGRKTGALEGMLLFDGDEEEEAEEEEGASDVEDVEREDKATQTMPEELTHELLEALREKLDDPENYSEARDMIEHLYDIIKVEEEREMEEMRRRRERSVATDDDDEDDENLYDVIGPRPAGRRRKRRGVDASASCNSVGTRVPSPDKLEPVLTASASLASLASIASIVSPLGSPMPPRGGGGARKRRPAPKAPAVCEYVEPKDRAQHLYTELPSNGTPEASDPRPPRLRMNEEQKEGPQRVEAPDPPPPPSVPLKFLRALGETFLTPNKPPRVPPQSQKTEASKVKSNGGILCEYTEPTDAKVHVYTELPPLPPSSTGSSPSHNHQLPVSMANRPLPHKPDSPGEGPSSAFVSR